MSSNFVKTFLDAVDKVEADAKEVGMTFTSICRETKVSRATPDRWRKKIPKTVLLLAEMQDIVEKRRAEPVTVEIDGIEQKLATDTADGLHVEE